MPECRSGNFRFSPFPVTDGILFNTPFPKSVMEDPACIGEVKSIIYAPYYRQSSYWFDAVLNQPIQTAENGPFSPQPPRDVHYSWKVSFLPVLCPDCGWDLAAENESRVLFCPQCDSAWEPEAKGFKKIGYEVIQAPGFPEGFFYLPFWRFTPLPGTKAYKLLEPGGPFFTFWLPAFKIAPRLFLLLGKRMTQAQTAGPPLKFPGCRTPSTRSPSRPRKLGKCSL